MDGQSMSLPLRPPATVMRLARMGASHPTRLSFMRILLRRLEREHWRFDRPLWQISDKGVGRAIYRVTGPDRSYSLVAFAHDLPDHLRSDRVIAEAWDATFALFDGDPSAEDLDRLEANVPLQEAGRVSGRELTLSRANRSVRLFAHVIDALAAGRQPDPLRLAEVGYLMRTTAVYGSAKFGLSDREAVCDRHELTAPFQAEMLTVWLIRAFTVDLVEHLARVRNPDAAALNRDLARSLGVGNSTGLGMAPFLLTHPVLINNWMSARETALARVRTADTTPERWAAFVRALEAATENAEGWEVEDAVQAGQIADLRVDLSRLADHVAGFSSRKPPEWDTLWCWAESALSPEGQEQLLALMLEPHGDLVDDLAETMAADEDAVSGVDGRQTVGVLRQAISTDYGWAVKTPWKTPETTARLWYVSAEKLEPRLAERADEPLVPYEQALAPGRDIAELAHAVADWTDSATVAELLVAKPSLRGAVRRVQIVSDHPYAEIRDNTIDAAMRPIDMLRSKLAFFGAQRFDPRSDRWLRISMFSGAPYPCDLGVRPLDRWMYG